MMMCCCYRQMILYRTVPLFKTLDHMMRSPSLLSLLVLLVRDGLAFQNLFTPPKWKFPSIDGSKQKTASILAMEDELLAAISNTNRLSNDADIETLIETLEQTPSIPEPAVSRQIYGAWRLLYTTAAATSSPIQRKAVNAQQFPIYQDIVVSDTTGQLVVKQIVKFSESAVLSVDALASTAAYPLAELQERQSTGKVLGMNLLGVSLVGEEAQPDANRPNSRIDFVFDEGNFMLGEKFKIPYPVPFRLPLFRDWVKGWIDITYLSNRIRISRGNKGTTFVLLKEEDE